MIRRKRGGGNADRPRVQSQDVSLGTSETRVEIDYRPISIVMKLLVSGCTPINAAS